MMKPPPLRDDCFAMPRGVEWTPVDVALDRLRDGLDRVVGTSQIPTNIALGRILAADVVALADHPPFANAAVDGYGFAHADLPDGDEIALPLVDGRAAAGQAYGDTVANGYAIRILTGAAIPKGVDTVILQEDVNHDDTHIYFRTGLRAGANARPQGEDIKTGQKILTAGHRLHPADMGVLASSGVSNVLVYDQLRVAVLTTGAELVDAGKTKGQGQIFDANRPMLLAQIAAWGYTPVDIGILPDDAEQIATALDRAAQSSDVILTTGGASAGDEDHISKLLTERGNLQTWRIAVKPGRPLALALWNGTPVFGLPGNPVAAMVCTHIFARPACGVLSGQGWLTQPAIYVPAAFKKNKKHGRQEYLRARLNEHGHAEVFASEGSGRISGLSWADGLVALDHGACDINAGDLVRYISLKG
jgi:molybdopterin molybdotransferase